MQSISDQSPVIRIPAHYHRRAKAWAPCGGCHCGGPCACSSTTIVNPSRKTSVKRWQAASPKEASNESP